MANRYAVATGNWSNTATWDGGTLPTSGDDVRPNGFTVTIDQNITVQELTDNALAPAVQGGIFQVTATGITITSNVVKRGTTNTGLLTIQSGANNTTLIGDVNHVSGIQGQTVNILNTGVTNITGNCACTASNNGIYTILCNATSGTLNFNGNVTSNGTSPSLGAALELAGNMTINFTGTITGASTGAAGGAAFKNTSLSGILTGNVSVIAGTINPAIWNASANNNIVINSATFADGISPIRGAVRFSTVAPTVTVILSNLSTLTLTDPSATNPPAEADVRDGIIYGGGAYEGTLVVPIPANVRLGVSTDNTVGTGIITGVDFFNYINGSSEDLAVRLKNLATVQTVGDQFNSF